MQVGRVAITLEEDDPKAVGFILRIAHHNPVDIDTDLSLEEIANVADKYDCVTLLGSHIKGWIPKLVAREPVGQVEPLLHRSSCMGSSSTVSLPSRLFSETRP